jgi:hypothetical protein
MFPGVPDKFHELRIAAQTAALRGCSMFAISRATICSGNLGFRRAMDR